MSRVRFPYRVEHSRTLGRVSTPLLSVDVFSPATRSWWTVGNVLADTGSDFTVFPMELGRHWFLDVRAAQRSEIYGITPDRSLPVYLHDLNLRIGSRRFRCLAGIVDSERIPPILGRYQALDRFSAIYTKGRALVLEW